MIAKRLAVAAALAVLGTAGCSNGPKNENSGGAVQAQPGMRGDSTGMNGGATTGSEAGPADAAGTPTNAPPSAGGNATTPTDTTRGGTATAAGAGMAPPTKTPPAGPSNVSTPSGNGTPPAHP